jgi:ATP-dependent helicase HrpB
MRLPLPIDEYLPAILDAVRRSRAVVVTAAPGAGKTTRVPPALVEDGPVLLLQPRRVAARAIAQRIATERGWTVGGEVGWHIRFDRRFRDDTRLLVATEGILTARLQQDRRLSGFRTVVLDEFHERSIHADVGLALARHAWLDRRDLQLVVMSATIDADRVAAFLGDCPVVRVPGRTFPLDVSYRPSVPAEQAVAEAVSGAKGAVLCFLPGAAEIRRTAERLAPGLSKAGIVVLPLHGGLDADEQDRAIQPAEGRRVILATNIAETTLTVPDVTCVVDTGSFQIDASRSDAGDAASSMYS